MVYSEAGVGDEQTYQEQIQEPYLLVNGAGLVSQAAGHNLSL